MYPHEIDERQPNKHPMCTEWPERTANPDRIEQAYNYIIQRNLPFNLAIDNGWYVSCKAGDGYTRIVIPAVTHKVGHLYWQARDITGQAYIRYQSPKGPRHEALVVVRPVNHELGTTLGNLIVEGPMDALAAAGEGYTGYALMGMHPSTATMMHLALLLDEDKKTRILLDRDSSENGLRVCTFLASNSIACLMGVLPGPEKDLAACLKPKRKGQLNHLFLSR